VKKTMLEETGKALFNNDHLREWGMQMTDAVRELERRVEELEGESPQTLREDRDIAMELADDWMRGYSDKCREVRKLLKQIAEAEKRADANAADARRWQAVANMSPWSTLHRTGGNARAGEEWVFASEGWKHIGHSAEEVIRAAAALAAKGDDA